MLIHPERLEAVYGTIKDSSLRGGCTVLIFVMLDTDAVCACRIITMILKSDNIAYKIKPVSGYEDILRDYAALVEHSEEIKSVIMIGCGGGMNITENLPAIEEREDLVVYLIDSHRPYDHHNLLEEAGKVLVFGDAEILENLDTVPSWDDGEEEDEDDEGEDDNEESSKTNESTSTGEEEFGEEEGNAAKRKKDKKRSSASQNGDDSISHTSSKKKRSRSELSLDGENEESNDGEQKEEEEEEEKEGNKADDEQEEKISKKKMSQDLKRERAERYREYYRGTYFGQPCAHAMYTLAQQTGKDTNELLWLAIIGTTQRYLQQQMTEERYYEYVELYRDWVMGMNAEEMRFTQADDGTSIPIMEEGRIQFIEELKLMLYRHWSLYSSLFYSEYVSTRLCTWHTEGTRKLETFLATMGISLKEAQQKFSFMSTSTKKALFSRLTRHAEEFNLGELTYGSFQRQMGFNNVFSAADMVHSLNGILISNSTENNKLASSENETNTEEGTSQIPQNAFNAAYDAIDFKSSGSLLLIQHGIQKAQELQVEAVKIGASLEILCLVDFRYAIVPDAVAETFYSAQSLLSLARFVVTMHKARGKWTGPSAKPFLLGVKRLVAGTILFVGIDISVRNTINQKMRAAGSKIDARMRYDEAESSIEIAQVDLTRYLIALNSVDDDNLV